MKISALVLIGLLPCWAQQTQSVQKPFDGVVTGSLKGDDGTAIVGGYVSLQLLPSFPKSRTLRTERTAVTAAQGSFLFSGLPEGKYRLCAQMPNSTWLNPCSWGLQAPVISLSPAQPAANITMALKRGVAVPIRVDDPGQLLSQNEGKTFGAHLLIGVGDDAPVFQPVSILPPGTNGANRQIVIPFNSPRKLVVFSSFFQLTDAVGIPLPTTAATAIPVLVPSGQQPAMIVLKVTRGGR